jgi:hypothetical protein
MTASAHGHGGAHHTYGTSHGPFSKFHTPNEFFVNRGQRKRLDLVTLLIALFAPWTLFTFVVAVLSFEFHYYAPYMTYLVIILTFLFAVCIPGFLALQAMKRKYTSPATYQPNLYFFLFVACVLAYFVGITAGEGNYLSSMYKYYSLTHLTTYDDIDTTFDFGQQYMDAGVLKFKQGTLLDTTRSMGFKNTDMYCVAPIVTKSNPNNNKSLSYDFWAVGKGCCSGYQPDFHCPGFNDRVASGGIRLMHDEDRPFYRLAVQQAEAMYKISAIHPLFVEWVHDTDEAINAFAQSGYSYFILAIATYFLWQSFLVVCTSLILSKYMHYPAGINETSA